MIAYFVRYHARLGETLFEHLALLGITMLLSLVIAALLTIFLSRSLRAEEAALRVLGAVYAIPSLALFSILIPLLGIGVKTAIFVLTLYNQFLLIRNFCAGLRSVDRILLEAATGIGMTETQILVTVKVPLALPAIMAGIRLAVISTIGIGTIAAVINSGGLGTILFDGLRTMNSVKIIWGTILAAALALFANAILSLVEKKLRKKFTPHTADTQHECYQKSRSKK
ncbi:MAG: ABC transporter permease [Spirochaetaceae bacterium]|jgi:osmoprotectant transport system permease protein|nr:ABC transporter permease [Spirochaetaceae bacterium]